MALYLSQVWCDMDKKNKCLAMLNLTSHLLPLFRGWYSEMFDNGSSLDNVLRHDKIRRPFFDLLSLDTVLDSVYGHKPIILMLNLNVILHQLAFVVS